MQNKQHICGSFPSLIRMYGSGGNSSFVIQERIMQHFLCFSKDKSPKFQYHLEQDKQQLRPSHIISINYLDLDQAYATHEFQVQSKFLYQNSRIQNSGNSRLKTRYLKGITIEQLFIISIAKDYHQSPFIQLLKIENQTHTFYFIFIFKITPYYYI